MVVPQEIFQLPYTPPRPCALDSPARALITDVAPQIYKSHMLVMVSKYVAARMYRIEVLTRGFRSPKLSLMHLDPYSRNKRTR
jgi:hypothetical protein